MEKTPKDVRGPLQKPTSPSAPRNGIGGKRTETPPISFDRLPEQEPEAASDSIFKIPSPPPIG